MYSQNNEDGIILEYFKGKTGNFIDFGSNDGITFSNTRALVEKGWKGVLIEPSPKAYEKLKALYDGYKGIYTYQVAIGGHNGKAMLQESGPLCTPNDVGLVSTFNPSEMERFRRKVDYNPVEVKVFKWKTFLNRLTIKEFDFVSMDVEGNELDILPDMDLATVKCICLEWNGKADLKVEYEKYLKGFTLIYTSPENLIYAR